LRDPNRKTPKDVTLKKLGLALAVLLVLSVAVGLGCSLFGPLGFEDLTINVWKMRLLRIAAAAAVGAALASGGVALQGLLRNPLAEPYILGISSGAGVGVLLGLTAAASIGLPQWATTPTLAFVGAIVTCMVVYGIAQRSGKLDPYVLLLSGVIINSFNGAIMLAIFLLTPPRVVIDFVRWGMGELSYSTPPGLLMLCSGCVVLGWLLLMSRAGAFNALGLGDDVASSSGVAVQRLRIETFAAVGLMTAAAVALAGPIGFLGLIVPHICRFIAGPDHRRLVIFSAAVGAMFLMLADTLCRTTGSYLATGNIPVGIITAVSGGPFFIYLLRRRSRGASE